MVISMPLQTGTVLNNRYRIVKPLGQGGFGAVYRAWDLNLQKPFALKENTDTSEEAKRQFFREAQMLSTLTHANLPRVIDHFLIQGQGQYLVMDFAEGEDLETIVARQGPLAESLVLPWMGQICDALVYLHSQAPPIVHRDVKPANIRITPQGKAVLVDFGIAKIQTPGRPTTSGARAVTPGYSPPEQYVGGGTTPRSDIYALGATLYKVLTGIDLPESVSRVISAQSPGAQLARVDPPHTLRPGISQVTSLGVMRAIEPDAARRFASAAEFKQVLLRLGPPVGTTQGPQAVVHPQAAAPGTGSPPAYRPTPAVGRPQAAPRATVAPPHRATPFSLAMVLTGPGFGALIGELAAALPWFFLKLESPLYGPLVTLGMAAFAGVGAALGGTLGRRLGLNDPLFLPCALISLALALAGGLILALVFGSASFAEGPTWLSGAGLFIGAAGGAVLGVWMSEASWLKKMVGI